MQAQPRHGILIAIPWLKIVTDMVANELHVTIYNATNISFLATKNSRFVTIIATSFLYVKYQLNIMVIYAHFMFF